MGKCVGLAGSGPGNDEERTGDMGADRCYAVLHRTALLGVESSKIVGARHGPLGSAIDPTSLIMIRSRRANEARRICGVRCRSARNLAAGTAAPIQSRTSADAAHRERLWSWGSPLLGEDQ